MAAMRKFMTYLGLADGEEQRYYEPVMTQPAPTQPAENTHQEQNMDQDPPYTQAGSYTELQEEDDYRAPVTPINRGVSNAAGLRQITTVHPRSYNDAKIIGESFRDGIPVIMNVTEMGEADAKRLVDFSAGLVFGMHGTIERVTNKVFLLSPSYIEVLGDDKKNNANKQSILFNQS